MVLLWLTVDPAGPDEIPWWWDARALRPWRWYKTVSVLAAPDAVADGRFSLDPRTFCQNGVLTLPHFVVASGSVPDGQLHDIAQRLGFAPPPQR